MNFGNLTILSFATLNAIVGFNFANAQLKPNILWILCNDTKIQILYLCNDTKIQILYLCNDTLFIKLYLCNDTIY